ncbi:MAG: hypothetical protein FJ109_09635 [Deltaproteobacteria bacterium]|nr:hypothetical protein [Deltaproteobacteria bacterium]
MLSSRRLIEIASPSEAAAVETNGPSRFVWTIRVWMAGLSVALALSAGCGVGRAPASGPALEILSGREPAVDVVLPPDDVVLPPDDVVLPPDDAVLPPDDAVLPPDDVVLPPDDAVTVDVAVDGNPTDVAQPCDFIECGPDGLGGSCGECAPGEVCTDGLCTTPTGPNDCKGIFECFDLCGEGDQWCYQECVNNADIEGQMLYNEVMTCLADSGYFDCAPYDDACYVETFEPCKTVYYECVQGDASCMEMYSCMYGCPSGGPEAEECYNDCYFTGSLEALLQWDEWQTCLIDSGYYECSQWDEECLTQAWEPCALPFKECVHGELSCAGIMECFQDCPPMMEECWLQCYYSGTVDAQYLYDALFVCVQGICGANPKPMCRDDAMKEDCAWQAKACEQGK